MAKYPDPTSTQTRAEAVAVQICEDCEEYAAKYSVTLYDAYMDLDEPIPCECEESIQRKLGIWEEMQPCQEY